MDIQTYDDAIAEARDVLKIASSDFALLPIEQAAAIIMQIENQFVDGHQWIWWWEHFTQPDYVVWNVEGRAFNVLPALLPELNANVWFVVEPWDEKRQFSVYSALSRHIEPVLGECGYFEYYIVAPDLSWLVGENHHGAFFCIGKPVTTRMRQIVESEPQCWR